MVLVVGGVVIVAVIVVIALVGVGGSDSAEERGADDPVRAQREELSSGAREGPRDERDDDQEEQTNYNHDLPLAVALANASPWNPPRPLRFLITHEGAGSEAEARARVEEIRQRFLDGESSFTLIREHSEAPRGIPRELISRYEDLPPEEASPVIPIDGAFVVFFGTPPSPPDAGAS